MGLRCWALLVTLFGGVLAVSAEPAPVHVPVTANLAVESQVAAQRQLPILLVFSAAHCTYCELLEREILKPMLRSGDYADKILIRKVMLDGAGTLRDFQGRAVDAGSFATRRDVFVTPTMLFVDARGRELAPRLVGINTVELFGGLVDASIEQARNKLKAQLTLEPLARAQPAATQP